MTLQDETVVIEHPHAIGTDLFDIAQLLVNAGAPPTRLAVEQENLEDYFLRSTTTN